MLRVHAIEYEIQALQNDADDIITKIQDLQDELEQLCETCGEHEELCECNE
jgi:peptidoglycan hydrolase CwlO-like protein